MSDQVLCSMGDFVGTNVNKWHSFKALAYKKMLSLFFILLIILVNGDK